MTIIVQLPIPQPPLRLRFKPALANHMDCAMFIMVRNAGLAAEVALVARIRAAAKAMRCDSFAPDEEETQPFVRAS